MTNIPEIVIPTQVKITSHRDKTSSTLRQIKRDT